MHKFIVRQPIKDIVGTTFGYEILFHVDDEHDKLMKEYAAADTIFSFLLQNSEKLLSTGKVFITFTMNLLLKNTPKLFKPDNLIIQIDDSVIVHPLAENVIKRYREEGYKFCINDFQYSPRYFSFLELVDYLKIDVGVVTNEVTMNNLLQLGNGFNKKCIITGINDESTYNSIKEINADYYQGGYIAEAMSVKANKAEFMQSNFFELLVAVTSDEPNLDEVEEIITRDATLTYALLKMVNSVHFALRHRTASIKQALTILGLNQLKQWVYLLSFEQKEPASTSSEEILKISFQRANFCHQLYKYIKDLGITKSDAYILGMFSTIEALVDAPAEEVINEIPIVDDVKKAIISQEGKCGTLLKLVLSYEKADWKNIALYANSLDIPMDILAQVYFDCIERVNVIWDNIMKQEEQ